MNRRRLLASSILLVGLALASIVFATTSQAAADPAAPKVTGSRFEFEVIESFDAKYLGDTPGHHGRNGGLGQTRPKVLLNDPVYRGETVVGHVTTVVWDRVNGGLNIEFDPAPLQQISVGDVVWIRIDGGAGEAKRP